MTLREEREKLYNLAAEQVETIYRHQEMFARGQDLLEKALDVSQRQARLLEWLISGGTDDAGPMDMEVGSDDEPPFDACACAECAHGRGENPALQPDAQLVAQPAAAPVGPGGIPRTSYVQRVDPDRFPNLARQIEHLASSEAHALAFVPSWTAEKLIGRFGKLIVRHRPDLRAGLADFEDVAARLNEFFEMDVAVFAVRGSDTLLMLVDRPSKGIMGLGHDPNLFTGNGHLASDVALEIPPKEAVS